MKKKDSIKIKIIKCSNEGCWYFDKIGQTFDVIRESGDMGYLVKKNITIDFHVDKEDCEIVKK